MMNRHGSLKKIVLGCVDVFAILLGIILARTIHSVWGEMPFFEDRLLTKVLVVVFVFQITFYYFGLYEFKKFQQKKGLAIALPGAIGISSLILGVVYYLIPHVAFDRSAFLMTVFIVGMITFFTRMLCLFVVKTQLLRERILIIGTGETAKKVRGEILENGHDDFEIVGFIDESREKIGKGI